MAPVVPEVVQPADPEPAQPPEIPETDIPAPAVLPESDEDVWQPASVDDMNADERAALGPLIKTVGDCNIYIEIKISLKETGGYQMFGGNMQGMMKKYRRCRRK